MSYLRSVSGLGETRTFKYLSAQLRVPLYRNAYLLAINTVSTACLGFFYWLLTARLYSAQSVGLNSAFISAMMYIGGISSFGLHSALLRFIPNAGNRPGRFIASTYLGAFAISMVISILFLLGQNLLMPEQSFLKRGEAFVCWFVLAIALWDVFTLQDGALTGLRQPQWVIVENFLFGVAKIVLLIILATSIPGYGIFASWMLPVVVLIVPVNWLIFCRVVPKLTASEIDSSLSMRGIAGFLGGAHLSTIFEYSTIYMLPLVVIAVAGEADNAYFYISRTLTYSLSLVAGSMCQSLVVEGAIDQTRLGDYTLKLLKQLILLFTPAVFVLIVAAPIVLSVFGEDYVANGTNVLRLLSLAAIPGLLNTLCVYAAFVRQDMHKRVVISIVDCALTLTLSMLFLPRFGIVGVGLACLLSQIVNALVFSIPYLYRTIKGSPS
jgi:O-antigen/teichoic acid export membrane protein